MTYKKHNADLIATIIMAVVFFVFYRQTGRISDQIDILFPLFVLYSILFLIILLGIKAFIKPERKEIFNETKIKNVWVGAGTCFIWVGLINYLGFIVSGFIVLMFITIIVDKSEKKKSIKYLFKNILINLLIVFFVYLIFAKFLEVPLPTGLLI